MTPGCSKAPARRDSIVTRVAAALDAPVPLVSIVDEDRQYLKSCVGVAEPFASTREMELSHSYCDESGSAGLRPSTARVETPQVEF